MIGNFTVIVGGLNVTNRVNQLTFSNVDPGGFEMCTMSLSAATGIRPGDRVFVFLGLEVAWDGRVNDPGNGNLKTKLVDQINALGHGTVLKDGTMQEIYIDRDLSHWTGAGVQRRINVIGGGAPYTMLDPQVVTDNAAPSLKQSLHESTWGTGAERPQNEGWYDGGGVIIDSIYYAWKRGPNIDSGNPEWEWDLNLASNDIASSNDGTGSLRDPGPSSGNFSTFFDAYFAWVGHRYIDEFGTASAKDIFWTCLAVYGAHGLPFRGSSGLVEPSGFYASDIAGDALRRVPRRETTPVPVRVDVASSYVIRQAEYRAGISHHDLIDQMAKIVAFHWGVWEPGGLHNINPGFYFQQRPSEATVFASRRDMSDFDAPKVLLDQLYDRVDVSYTDAAGRRRTQTTTVPNDLLNLAGYSPRTISVDMGLGSSAAAITYGTFILNLSQAASRGAGSCVLTDDVVTEGGRKPSCLVKAGRDRIRINDLPDPGYLHESDSRRFDTFRVKRVETTVERGGNARTRIEFDGGADLLEVLDARLSAATSAG